MIQTLDITFGYDSKDEVFKFPNINLKAKEHLLIVGKSGIGKTTLLHLLAGLLPIKTGSICINSTRIEDLSQKKLDAFRGEHIGLVFQRNHALKSLTVAKNLQARLFFSRKPINYKRINEVLTTLDLLDYKDKSIQTLSTGQLQRLGIAMAIIHNPKLILADEPTSSLDDENCENVMNLLLKEAQRHQANLVVITHDKRIVSKFSKVLML
ncbi:ABC transporter ATP-binding protein [Neptunitalea lumnitzerae]|uniref:ABC transporter ATP-binding protein n=1 Tax=Neptunitalea lumnitzerae TaxID=2965509 RepID=A0ABQ5MK82_9FLAO|nr:ATP-binding cassette domain-containing protein [Neptunitalea sp. Y10]GLB49821.1 ABC transporter ATP-binding protein [Neptunitalea sp. Y10]